METIFEKAIEKEGETGRYFEYVRCSKAEATHVHFCYEDRPCKRIKIEDYVDG